MTETINGAPDAPNAARQRLAALIARREEIAANIRRLEAQRDRLMALQRADDPVVAALAELSAQEAAEMTLWSRSGEGPAPVADVVKRDELNARLSVARAGAEAARNALASVSNVINLESRNYAEIAPPIQPAVAAVMFEEAEPLIEEFEKMNSRTSESAMQIQQVARMAVELAHTLPAGEARSQLFAMNAAFLDRLAKVNTRPVPRHDIANEQRAKWARFATALNASANATLEA